jgi:hypothetical protein
MDEKEFETLVDQKLLTDVSFVSHYTQNEEELEKLQLEDLSNIGMATSLGISNYILPDFEQGGEFVLENDIELFNPIIITKDTTVDLNGHDIINRYTFAYDSSEILTDSYVFWVKSGKLTIKGDGFIKSGDCEYSMAAWANGGDIEIHGGKFYNEGVGSDLIYASAGGSVEIYGGEFHPNKKLAGVPGTLDEYTALNVKDKDREVSKIVVYGGKFYNFDPANNQSEGPATDFVASGYESIEVQPNVWEVKSK